MGRFIHFKRKPVFEKALKQMELSETSGLKWIKYPMPFWKHDAMQRLRQALHDKLLMRVCLLSR
ncbi:hypothetical protein RT723_06570 [Psychrosphaera aquimarina]|uniref:Uncharacterized protein n=1 Tax=Psychrosphaera aquimarina TaxID=2044854 RepID=A0ABU3QZ30_9GAMM|nr:hypothetical protein [Psychrosphaera aquimarina]MDU0112672.1 hypothetical protein [Psychrosphaera aquimarina]